MEFPFLPLNVQYFACTSHFFSNISSCGCCKENGWMYVCVLSWPEISSAYWLQLNWLNSLFTQYSNGVIWHYFQLCWLVLCCLRHCLLHCMSANPDNEAMNFAESKPPTFFESWKKNLSTRPLKIFHIKTQHTSIAHVNKTTRCSTQ